MQSIHEIVRDGEDNYIDSEVSLGDYVKWSMHETIERIDAYLNSKHTSGEYDSLGREKPFFNIVTAATNVWYRATDIDRKDIHFIPDKDTAVVLALVANTLLQQWMDKNKFGIFLNQWGRALARYGSAVTKFVKQDGKLVASVVPWNRLIVDQVDFYSLPVIEKLYKTPAQLRKHEEYDQDVVEALISAIQARENLDGQQKDNKGNFVELYEVHGEFPTELLKDGDKDVDESEAKFTQQMHVISFVLNEKGEYEDYTLYKGREAQNPYYLTHLIEEDGRTLSIGAVESLFNSQWMINHSMKNIKDTLDLASKLIFQTADTRYAGRNVLSAIETGDLFIHQPNMPLVRVGNDKPDITAQQNFGTLWVQNGQEVTNTPEAIRGTTLPSGTPYSLGAYLGGQAGSLFEIMTENKGLHLEEMLRNFVIPELKKELKNKDQVVAILDDSGVTEIDSIYIPKGAIKRYNQRAMEQVLSLEVPEPFDQAQAEQSLKQEMGAMGNKRFFAPDELGEKQWDEIFSDFQWDNIRIEVTNEQQDKQATLQTLATLYQGTLQTNPVMANLILSRILTETGLFSPIQIATASSQPSPQPVSSQSGTDISNLSEVA